MKLLHPKMILIDPLQNMLSLLLISFAAVTFVESYGELVKPKHEHVHDCKSSKFLIRAMCTIDDEMSPTRCHGMLSNSTMIVTWLMRP